MNENDVERRPHRFRASRVQSIFAACAIAYGLACTKDPPATGTQDEPTATGTVEKEDATGPIVFRDVTGSSGIGFVRDNGHDGKHWRIVETVNGGVALLDADGDGRLDIYFTNGRRIDPGEAAPRNALYHSLGALRFDDATEGSGAADGLLSLGCAVADVDGDGNDDIYVTNEGPDRLFRSRGNGTFVDIAREVGLGLDGLEAGAAFFDMDGDGDLDLYVASYVIDDPGGDFPPFVVRGVPGYFPPLRYRAAPDTLYENRSGTFVDVSRESGIRVPPAGRGLGVVASDIDFDGDVDLYVANDMSANFLFLNDGKGRFEDAGLLSGVAFSEEGKAQGSMGIDIADFDQDRLLDIAVTNYQSERNSLYRGSGARLFEDVARFSGFGEASYPEVSWGVHFADFDADGRDDLFVVNGHLNPGAAEIVDTTAYEQENRIFWNVGKGKLEDVSSRAGSALRVREVGRGSAAGDLDDDGDLDLVIVNSFGLPQILENRSAGGAWALVSLRGRSPNTSAIGARVTVETNGRRIVRERRSSSSYLSAGDPRLHFGLGEAERIMRLEVRWPAGGVTEANDLPARRSIVVREEGGTVDVRALGAEPAVSSPAGKAAAE